MKRTVRRVLALLALSPLLPAQPGDQILEAVFERSHTLTGAGTSVAVAGDVDHDGYPDVIVGNPLAGFGGTDSGSAFVYSGRDGSLLWRFDGAASDLLGSSVAGAGDINGDGLADVIVGAPGSGEYRGSALVLSGRGTVLWRLESPFSRGAFGHSVDGGMDLDRDGVPDVVVGAPWSDPGARLLAGSVLAFSGKDGSRLFRLDGRSEGDRFGSAVAKVGVGADGDIDRDGVPDMIVGAERSSIGNGYAFVLSGRVGDVLWEFHQAASTGHDLLGSSVAGAGDVNLDGFPDVIVGAPRARTGDGSNQGSAFVYSGRDGAVLWRFDSGPSAYGVGTDVSAAGDVNQDGFPDLLLGTASGDAGYAFLYSGKDGTLLWRFESNVSGDRLGTSVAGGGDIDRDGFADVILGAPDRRLPVGPGSAFVYRYTPTAVAYGTGLPGTGNAAPILRTAGGPPRAGAALEISLQLGLGVSPALIAGSRNRAATPFMGLTLYGDFLTPGAYSTWSFLTGGFPGIGATGIATLEIVIANDPSLAGLTTFWQGFVMDPASPAPVGVSHTAGLAITIVK